MIFHVYYVRGETLQYKVITIKTHYRFHWNLVHYQKSQTSGKRALNFNLIYMTLLFHVSFEYHQFSHLHTKIFTVHQLYMIHLPSRHSEGKNVASTVGMRDST